MMKWNSWSYKFRRLDLQVRIVLVLILVIGPTYLLVSLAVGQITVPVIEDELRALGSHSAVKLAEDIHEQRLMQAGKEKELEQLIQETFYFQPNVLQVDAFRHTEQGDYVLIASTRDLEPNQTPERAHFPDSLASIRKEIENDGIWEIWAPIRSKNRGILLGGVRVEVSLQSASGLSNAVWKIMAIAGFANIILLVLGLGYFLRKTILNDRRLRIAENQNLELMEQLHDAERKLMIQEKLAAMGQLTAEFAHEIGTPLNATGGHIQLLQEELKQDFWENKNYLDRLSIIQDQLGKIEKIVKAFLQSTSKPASQVQLTDLNRLLEKTLSIVKPRVDRMQVQLIKKLDSAVAPVKAVPMEIEQVLLNLMNNSLDSIQEKQKRKQDFQASLEVFSRLTKEDANIYAEIGVFDTGQGISKENLTRVFTPFFTTKAIGEGTGLGLSICQDIARKYNGKLIIESKEGVWTRVTVRLPYGVNL